MSVAKLPEWSLRQQRAEATRLAWAFALSVAFHLVIAATYQAGNKLGWWQNWHLPTWMQSPKMLTEILKKKENAPPQPTEVPLMFVDVNPAVATPDPPKTAPYYSDKNSKAANPDASVDTATPKIEGKQTQVAKTENVPRNKTFPLQPTVPAPPAKEPAQEEVKPKPSHTPGDLALAKPEPTPRKGEGEAPEPKPRTVAEAKARLQNSQL